jgi:hypothetical protein
MVGQVSHQELDMSGKRHTPEQVRSSPVPSVEIGSKYGIQKAGSSILISLSGNFPKKKDRLARHAGRSFCLGKFLVAKLSAKLYFSFPRISNRNTGE